MIHKTIERLRQLTEVDVQNNWYSSSEETSIDSIDSSNWKIAQLNDKRYITWSSGHQIQWLTQKFIIPNHLQSYPLDGLSLRLGLTWWAEDVQIFVNKKLVQSGDLFDSSARILLTPSAIPGEEIIVTLRLVSPGHDIGALMRSKCIYERNQIDPGFVADELTVLYNYLQAFEPEKIESLETAINQINWNCVSDVTEFDQSLAKLRQTLLPLATNIKQRSLHLLGHAHLDMAWLWTVDETWEVAQRTFASVLNLQKDFPALTFCHTSPVLYAWIEKHRPDIFSAIQEAAMAGCWEVLGGMWVEPEVNLVSGESLVRQLLYGQRYIEQKFGKISQVAWLPDSFGFSWQLPQIFKQSGIKYFVTGKLHWNDTNKFPHGIFYWRSPDGTQLLTLISPPNVAGVMDTNPLTMANYAVDWELQTGLPDAFWLPGVGDHGGGPSRDMLEVQQRWQSSPFFPQIKFTTAINYLQKVEQEVVKTQNSQFTVWNDELYLEFHRGCYTTHADQKFYNRRCEGLLYQAELWSSLATIIRGKDIFTYPKNQLEEAWKNLLFNQFHDILPGTSIPEVFIEANQTWQAVEKVGEKLLQESLEAIASNISLPQPPQPNAQPIVIFNSLNWQRSEVVAVTVSSGDWEIYNLLGQKLPSQLSENNQLLFLAQDIPSVGYQLFWLCQNQNSEAKIAHKKSTLEFILENDQLRVIVNSETGNLSSIFDKINQREILKGEGNQLQAFQDQGQYWDAWNIDPNYSKYPLPPTQLKSIQYLDFGPIQWRIRVIRQLNHSEFSQDYILEINSPILKIATTVNWQETHVLVKAAFPLTVTSDYVTYEIPCAAIQRPTQPQTSTEKVLHKQGIIEADTETGRHGDGESDVSFQSKILLQLCNAAEKAKWEVPALHWADLTISDEYGVSLLNDCKYGYDAQPDQLRLTLLRSSQWPDPNADTGNHHFTYALYPHLGSWQRSKTVHHGYELNFPLIVMPLQSKILNLKSKIQLPTVSQLLNLQSENLILMAIKQSEDEDNKWILRCYECHGEIAELSLETDLDLTIINQVDLLEKPIEQFSLIQPWKIASYQLTAIFK